VGTVIILAGSGDPQAVRVRSEIRNRRGRALLVDTAAFPERLSLSLGEKGPFLDARPLPRDVSAVYVRALGANPVAPQYRADLHSRPEGLLAQLDERLALLASLVLILKARGARIVNDLEVNAQHSRKPYQLDLLRSAGLPVPRSLASNEPAAVRAFVQTVGRAVYKPLGGGATVRAVRRQDLTRARLASLALAPVLFQERVDGVSVRAYVVGGRCVAAGEIHSTELDYRRKEDAVLATTLTKSEQRACVAAARACAMTFAGVDLVRGKDSFHLLECNPSPMFAVFEEKTGADIAGPLAEWLLAQRR